MHNSQAGIDDATLPNEQTRLKLASELRIAACIRCEPGAIIKLGEVLTDAEQDTLGSDALADVIDLLCGEDDEKRLALALMIVTLYGPELGHEVRWARSIARQKP